MGRKSKPYWWEAKKGYYSKIQGKRHRLGDTKREAEDALKVLLRTPRSPQATSQRLSVLLDEFLTWTLENRAQKTYGGYRDFCQSFKDKWPDLNVSELRPAHVTEWLSLRTTWNSTTKRNAITCLQRALNWAEKNWNLDKNPLRRMEKPEAKRRELIIDPATFKKILSAIKDDAFRELLIFSDEVGCRAVEAKQLEARHVNLPLHLCVIPKAEAKGKRKDRVIYLTAGAEKIIKRLIKERPSGHLFLNLRGRPWTAAAVKCRFERLEETLGVRYCQTHLRHSWITRKIIAGVDSHVVGQLAGHSDSSMIDRVYSKAAADHKFMLDAARRK